MSVGVDFFARAIKAATKVHGNRAVSQEQWNALVAAAGEFERIYKECERMWRDELEAYLAGAVRAVPRTRAAGRKQQQGGRG